MTPLQRDVLTRLASLRAMLDRVESLATQEPQDGRGVQGAALAALECHAAADTDLGGIRDLLVRQARVEQASWTQIAEPLGMTKQGAQQRWGTSLTPTEVVQVNAAIANDPDRRRPNTVQIAFHTAQDLEDTKP